MRQVSKCAAASVPGTGHSKDYYEKVGGWISNDGPGGYNEYVRREARDLYTRLALARWLVST